MSVSTLIPASAAGSRLRLLGDKRAAPADYPALEVAGGEPISVMAAGAWAVPARSMDMDDEYDS